MRNGRGQERAVTGGGGDDEDLRAPRVNDKRLVEGERQRFASKILPPLSAALQECLGSCCRCSTFGGLSRGDSREALPVLLGEDATGLLAEPRSRAW